MQLEELLRQRGEFAVDEIVGQIIQVDRVKERTSRYGPPQLVQDVVFQTPDHRKFVVAFYDFNLRCLTKRKPDGDSPAHFTDRHKQLWLRLRNSAKNEKKANLRCLDRRDKSFVHWSKFGAEAVLKATGTVDASWLLDRDQQIPVIHSRDDVIRPRRLRVPGQAAEPPRERPTNPEPPRREPQPAQEREPMADFQPVTRAVARYAGIAHKALNIAYDQAQDITRPRGDQLVRTVSTIMIALKKKTNLLREDETHVKRLAWFFAQMYVDQHRQVLAEFRQDETIRDELLMSLVTTCFIEASFESKAPQKPVPPRRGEGQQAQRQERQYDTR